MSLILLLSLSSILSPSVHTISKSSKFFFNILQISVFLSIYPATIIDETTTLSLTWEPALAS